MFDLRVDIRRSSEKDVRIDHQNFGVVNCRPELVEPLPERDHLRKDLRVHWTREPVRENPFREDVSETAAPARAIIEVRVVDQVPFDE